MKYLEFKDIQLYTQAIKAKYWLGTHWQKSGTDTDICGRPYEPKLFEMILEKYEGIADELGKRNLPEYPELFTADPDDQFGKLNQAYCGSLSREDQDCYSKLKSEEASFICPVVETRQCNTGLVEIRDHPTSALKIIDEQVTCTKCGVTWPKELTKHFSVLKQNL